MLCSLFFSGVWLILVKQNCYTSFFFYFKCIFWLFLAKKWSHWTHFHFRFFFSKKPATKMMSDISHLTGRHVCVTPLRMLLKRKTNPKMFSRIDMLMDHAEERSTKKPSQISMQLLKVILMLREACAMNEFSNTGKFDRGKKQQLFVMLHFFFNYLTVKK